MNWPKIKKRFGLASKRLLARRRQTKKNDAGISKIERQALRRQARTEKFLALLPGLRDKRAAFVAREKAKRERVELQRIEERGRFQKFVDSVKAALERGGTAP